MNSKTLSEYFAWLILTTVFFGCVSIQKTELDKKWPKKISFVDRFDIDPPLVKGGYILTTNNDTLKGYFKLRRYSEVNVPSQPILFLPFVKTKATDIVNIKINDINYIRVKQQHAVDSLDYKSFDSNLWLVIGQRNEKSMLFQRWEKAHSEQDEIIIVSEKKVIVRIPLDENKLGTRDTKFSSILKFINKRYDQTINKDSFKTEKEMFEYLIKKESLMN
jgi:hypothetical protein